MVEKMEISEALNQALFLQINAGAETSPVLISIAMFIAVVLIYLIPLVLLVAWLWLPAQRELAVKASLTCAIALGLGQAITLFWQHPRPFMIGLGHTWLAHAADASFPSDHGIVFASMALTLLLTRKLLPGLLLAVVGIAVAWSRIFLGVHFPFDMLGAVAVSLLAYVILRLLWSRKGTALMHALTAVYGWLMALPISKGWIRP